MGSHIFYVYCSICCELLIRNPFPRAMTLASAWGWGPQGMTPVPCMKCLEWSSHENPGRPGGTYFSPGGSRHRMPGLGRWRLYSCSCRRPSPGLSAGRGNGICRLHRPQRCLLVSSRGHLPGTRSPRALGSLKLQGQVKDVRLLESTGGPWTQGKSSVGSTSV